jgi:hypothetical protein
MTNTVQGVVHGRISDVKTKYSEDELPLDSAFADVMLDWQKRCPRNDGIGLSQITQPGLYTTSHQSNRTLSALLDVMWVGEKTLTTRFAR